MRKRKIHERICPSCGRLDIVRSDQLKSKCSSCQSKIGGQNLILYAQEHPEAAGNSSRKHGMHNTRLYRIHKSMMERCGHSGHRHKWAMYYEDRGIKVCEEWRSREVFFQWALTNGYADDLELDRIDNYKGYSPDNCRWVTHLVNMRNRRKSSASPAPSSSLAPLAFPSGTPSAETLVARS